MLATYPIDPCFGESYTKSFNSSRAGLSTGIILSIQATIKRSFFSVDPHQASLQSHLFLFNSHLRFNLTATFPDVTFDRTLPLTKYVSLLKAQFKALFCISSFFNKSLSFLYKAFLRFIFTCTLPGWFRFLALPTLSCQNAFTERPARHHRLPLVFPYPTSLF